MSAHNQAQDFKPYNPKAIISRIIPTINVITAKIAPKIPNAMITRTPVSIQSKAEMSWIKKSINTPIGLPDISIPPTQEIFT